MQRALTSHAPNVTPLEKQIIKQCILNIIHEYLAGDHKNGTAKDWGKSILRFAQLIMQEHTSVEAFDGECCSDSKYKTNFSLTSLLEMRKILQIKITLQK